MMVAQQMFWYQTEGQEGEQQEGEQEDADVIDVSASSLLERHCIPAVGAVDYMTIYADDAPFIEILLHIQSTNPEAAAADVAKLINQAYHALVNESKSTPNAVTRPSRSVTRP